MKLPNTDNAAHIEAFKHGYRQAIAGTPKSFIPERFLGNAEIENYWYKGWMQADAEYRPFQKNQSLIKVSLVALVLLGTSWAVYVALKGLWQDSPPPPQAVAKLDQLDIPTVITTEVLAESPTTPSAEQTPQQLAQDTIPTHSKVTHGNPMDAPKAAEEPRTQLTADDQPAKGLAQQATLPSITPEYSTDQQPPEAESLPGQTSPMANRASDSFSNPTATLPPENFTSVPQSTDNNLSIQVVESAFTSDTQNAQPVDFLTQVDANRNKIYFYTRIAHGEGQKIIHRWLYGDRIMAEVPLKIRSDLYRTRSSKNLAPGWQGQWRVQVLDEQGNMLHERSFILGNQANP